LETKIANSMYTTQPFPCNLPFCQRIREADISSCESSAPNLKSKSLLHSGSSCYCHLTSTHAKIQFDFKRFFRRELRKLRCSGYDNAILTCDCYDFNGNIVTSSVDTSTFPSFSLLPLFPFVRSRAANRAQS
jgi:hypothetical protein